MAFSSREQVLTTLLAIEGRQEICEFVFIPLGRSATSYGAAISTLCFHVIPAEVWEKGSFPLLPVLDVKLRGCNIITASSLTAQDLLHAITYGHKFPSWDRNVGETKATRDLLHSLLTVPPSRISLLPSLLLKTNPQALPWQETFLLGTCPLTFSGTSGVPVAHLPPTKAWQPKTFG